MEDDHLFFLLILLRVHQHDVVIASARAITRQKHDAAANGHSIRQRGRAGLGARRVRVHDNGVDDGRDVSGGVPQAPVHCHASSVPDHRATIPV